MHPGRKVDGCTAQPHFKRYPCRVVGTLWPAPVPARGDFRCCLAVFWFPLSLRMVENLLAQRGIIRVAADGAVVGRKIRISFGHTQRLNARSCRGGEHSAHTGLNNRAEHSHQPTGRRKRIMKRVKSPRHLQRFIAIHDPIAILFHLPRHEMTSEDFRERRATAMDTWREITSLGAA